MEKETIASIVDEAAEVLERTGVLIESDKALEALAGRGVRTEDARAYFSRDQIEKALETAPDRVTVYGRDRSAPVEIGGGSLHFNPGSSAIRLLDLEKGRARTPVTSDLADFAVLTDRLDGCSMQSTALVPGDVPESIAGVYRLYISLIFSGKPVVTGTFTAEGLSLMLRMLEAAAGGREELRRYPLAIFDACPTAPLVWSALTVDALTGCAERSVPVQIVPMPLSGATSPATIYGTVVQHCAENLSGVVITQLVSPGAPVVYGGSPAYFDMRKGTTPVAGVEAAMINGAGAELARRLGLPSHAYMALSDSKRIDYQAGMETSSGAVIAALSGLNNVSGPGMLNFQTTQSMEKLVLDNEICLAALRLRRGLSRRAEEDTAELIAEGAGRGSFLSLPHTRENFRGEAFFPGEVIDRGAGQGEAGSAGKEILRRAAARKEEILRSGAADILERGRRSMLKEIMTESAVKAGMDVLPDLEEFGC
jgi:trimethylamine--corrinoid protein Co-methyltransferase